MTVETDVLAELGEQLLRVKSRRVPQAEGAQLGDSAFRILWRLSRGGPRTMRELADELGLEQSTVHRQVHAAIAGEWVERYDEAGRAGMLLRPTPAGAAAFEHDGRARSEAVRAALAAMGPDRTRALTELLGEFNDALDSLG